MSKKVKTAPVHLQYWCKTSVIDEIVCQRKGIEFNRQLAESLEKEIAHYFVVDKKGNYAIVGSVDFEQHFDNKVIPGCEITFEAKQAIDKFIKQVHGV